MQLLAVSIDRDLADALRGGALRGAVLSAHRNAAYLEASGGRLIVLAREEVGDGPGFVLLTGVASFIKGEAGLAPGEPYETAGSLIAIGGGRVEVETQNAREWDATLVPRACPSSKVLHTCTAIAYRLAGARTPAGGSDTLGNAAFSLADETRRSVSSPPAHALVGERARAFSRALREADPEGVSGAAEALIGLGGGLTPSCDDMLVGLTAILTGVSADPRCCARARRVLDALRGTIARASRRTTPVSRHFLEAAAGGRFTERVKDLVETILGVREPREKPGTRARAGGRALRAEDEKRVAAAAKRMLEYGATSGADLIAGILLGSLTGVMGDRVRRN